jgi:REP element-mobilizing transposase RayT
MSRPLRIQYPGAVYHVTCRGNDRKHIFLDDEDRKKLLRILGSSLNIYSVKLHAYVLMDNHFHLLVETPLGNLSEFMRHFNISYTSFFNRRHSRVGHLYQGRYKSILVEKESYLSVLSRYIHLNPIRIQQAENSRPEEQLERLFRYTWSSLPGYLRGEQSGDLVDYTLVMAEYGGNTERGRALYAKQLISDITTGLNVKENVFGQSILGSDAFINWIRETAVNEIETPEQPTAGVVRHYQRKIVIMDMIEKELGKSHQDLKNEKGSMRRLAMDILYRHSGLKGVEIGALFGLHYSAVSQERKRLREEIARDSSLAEMMRKLEDICQQ